MNRITLEAPDISCDHCIQTIRTAVDKMPGARFISGDPDAKQVTVEIDHDETSRADVESAFESEGYPVRR